MAVVAPWHRRGIPAVLAGHAMEGLGTRFRRSAVPWRSVGLIREGSVKEHVVSRREHDERAEGAWQVANRGDAVGGAAAKKACEPSVCVQALYQFADVNDVDSLRASLLALCGNLAVLGTLIVAEEGINGTVAGSQASIDTLLVALHERWGFAALRTRRTWSSVMPFQRLKVRRKREIVTLRAEGVRPSVQTGIHVPPEDWDALLRDPEVLVLDTRNAYEVAEGSFEGAVSPSIDTFPAFTKYVDATLDPATTPRVAMFCTGGIRCEKASAWMLSRGFQEVYQLEGGILAYLAATEASTSKWRGNCFVFDERRSLDAFLEAPAASTPPPPKKCDVFVGSEGAGH